MQQLRVSYIPQSGPRATRVRTLLVYPAPRGNYAQEWPWARDRAQLGCSPIKYPSNMSRRMSARGKDISCPSRGTPGFLRTSLPSTYYWEDDWAWELVSPGLPPTRVPVGGSDHSYSISMLCLPYINVMLLAHSECVTAIICEIKIGKITIPCQT